MGLKYNLCPLFARGGLGAEGRRAGGLPRCPMEAVLSLLPEMWLCRAQPQVPSSQRPRQCWRLHRPATPCPGAASKTGQGVGAGAVVEGAKAWLTGRGRPLSKETGSISSRMAGDGVFTLRLGARGLTGAQLEHKPLLQAGGAGPLRGVSPSSPRIMMSNRPNSGYPRGTSVQVHD